MCMLIYMQVDINLYPKLQQYPLLVVMPIIGVTEKQKLKQLHGLHRICKYIYNSNNAPTANIQLFMNLYYFNFVLSIHLSI